MTKTALDAQTLTEVAVRGLQEIKGQNLVRMDLRSVDGAICDYFVLCTGTSDKHVQALAESAMKFMREEASEKPIMKEGLDKGEWVLLDYVNVIVHIFQQGPRDFYKLEELWGDAEFEHIDDQG